MEELIALAVLSLLSYLLDRMGKKRAEQERKNAAPAPDGTKTNEPEPPVFTPVWEPETDDYETGEDADFDDFDRPAVDIPEPEEPPAEKVPELEITNQESIAERIARKKAELEEVRKKSGAGGKVPAAISVSGNVKTMFKGRNAANAFIAAEVFGPPKAIRPGKFEE